MSEKKLLDKLESLANEWRREGRYLNSLSEALCENPTLQYFASIYFSHSADIRDLMKSLQDAEEIEKGVQ